MIYELLRELTRRNALLKAQGDKVAVALAAAAVDSLPDSIRSSVWTLKPLISRLGDGPLKAEWLLNEYLSGYTLVQNPAGLREAVKRLLTAPAVSIDLETTGLNPRRDKVRLITMADERETYVVDTRALYSVDFGAVLRPLFDGRRHLVFHNGSFDLEFLAYMGLEAPLGAVYDTGIAEQIIKHRAFMSGLDVLSMYYLGLELDKTLQGSDWSGRLTEEQLRYAASDARVTLLIHKKQQEELRRFGLERAARIDFDAVPAVVWMRMSGVPVDLECWMKNTEEVTAKAEEARAVLDRMVPGVNWNSHEQVLEILKSEGLPIEDTREDTLKAHASHPIVRALLEYRRWSGLVSRYGQNWLQYLDDVTGRFHPSWKVLGAETGRMSCANPNLTQVPRDDAIRRCFKAPPNRLLVKADLSQIELRLTALYAKDPVMLEAFRKGEDLHRKTGAAITGKAESDVTKDERQFAKGVNFGLVYGMSPQGFQRYVRAEFGMELSLKEAERIVSVFLETYPGIREWHKRAWLNEGPEEVRTLTGRRRVAKTFTAILNSPIQGTGADILKRSLALVYERRKRFPGAFPILAVHDEIVMEAPANTARDVLEHLVETMKEAANEITRGGVPIEVEAGIYRDWSAKEEVKE